MKTCKSCEYENKNDVLYCVKCGNKFEREVEPLGPPMVNTVSKGPKKKLPLGWIILGGITLFLAALIGLYFLFGRPLVQETITDLLEDSISEVEINLYQYTQILTEIVEQDAIDDEVDDLDLSSSVISLDEVSLEQDQIVVTLRLFDTIDANYIFDIRVNEDGEFVLNNTDYPMFNFLFFKKQTFNTWLEDSFNELIEDAPSQIKAIQVTAGQIYIVREIINMEE